MFIFSIIRLLDFLNLVDRERKLSLTNLLVYIAIFYLGYGIYMGATLEVFIPLILALLNYAWKRHQNRLSYARSELLVLQEELAKTTKLAKEAMKVASDATFNKGRNSGQ